MTFYKSRRRIWEIGRSNTSIRSNAHTRNGNHALHVRVLIICCMQFSLSQTECMNQWDHVRSLPLSCKDRVNTLRDTEAERTVFESVRQCLPKVAVRAMNSRQNDFGGTRMRTWQRISAVVKSNGGGRQGRKIRCPIDELQDVFQPQRPYKQTNKVTG